MIFNSLALLATLISVGAPPTAPKAEEDVTGAERAQYRPTGFDGTLMPYDLKKVFQANKAKRLAGRAHNYSSFLVKEFSEHYYAKAKLQWHTVRSTSRYVGIRKTGFHKVQEVFLSWESFGDGIQWGFFNGELERTTQVDPFAIIADAEIAKAIKRSLHERNLIDDPKDATDVFSYRTRFFFTAQRTSGLTFPDKDFGETQYGVCVGDTTCFFTAQGEQAE